MPRPGASDTQERNPPDRALRDVAHPAPVAEPSRLRVLPRKVGRWVGHEWSVLFGPLRGRSRWRPSSFTLALAACAIMLAASWVQQAHPGIGRVLLDERASLWWPVAAFRLPGSMFAPALRLPMWGALAQVLFCFGLAEVHLGRRTTLAVAAVTHSVATASARVFVALGPHAPFGLGLPHWYRWQRDTGPSAAVVGVGTYLGIKLRLPVLTSVLVATMVIEVIVKPDVADHEHLVAIATGGAVAILIRALQGFRLPQRLVSAEARV